MENSNYSCLRKREQKNHVEIFSYKNSMLYFRLTRFFASPCRPTPLDNNPRPSRDSVGRNYSIRTHYQRSTNRCTLVQKLQVQIMSFLALQRLPLGPSLPVSICMHLSELMSSWTYYEQADYHIMALPINAKFKHQTCNNQNRKFSDGCTNPKILIFNFNLATSLCLQAGFYCVTCVFLAFLYQTKWNVKKHDISALRYNVWVYNN